MSKQYTFKTTRRTSYLEEVLDALPSQDRSEFIRCALSSYLGTQPTPIVIPNPVTSHISVPNVSPCPTVVTQQQPVQKIDPPTIELVGEDKDEVDFDSKLNNLYD